MAGPDPRIPTASRDDLLIGVDIGTSSTKTILVTAEGRLLAASRHEYAMNRPRPDWAENDPDDWVRATIAGVKGVIAARQEFAARVRGLCICSQRDPIVLLDGRERVLAPSISWIDQRDSDETEAVYDRFGRDRLTSTTGLSPVPGLALPVLVWMRNHRPEVWRATKRVLAAKDYVLYRLTGQIATDITTPSRSMLYDLRRLAWSDWICREAGIDVALLPPVAFRPWERWCALTAEAAAALGLRAGTILAAGGGDDPAAALGAGAIEPGQVVVGTGTAASFRVVSDRPQPERSGLVDMAPHVVPDRYVFELIVTGTGTSLRWFRDTFGAPVAAPGTEYEHLIEEAAAVDPGADGLLFFPYLEGARAPHFTEHAKGVFFGLRSGHRRGHLVRAILEGVAFQYPGMLAMLPRFGAGIPNALVLVDDESRSRLWNRIKADVMGISVRTLRVPQGAAMGAAILAAQASGLYASAREAAAAMIKVAEDVRPEPASSATYAGLRSRYEEVYGTVAKAFSAAVPRREPSVLPVRTNGRG